MKAYAQLPVRIDPQLCRDAEDVLHQGETLAGFIEDAIRSRISRRNADEEFTRSCLEGEADAERTGKYYSVEEVLAELDKIIADGRERRAG